MMTENKILGKLIGMLAAIIVATAVLPMGLVTAKASGASFSNGKLKLTDVEASGLPSGCSISGINVDIISEGVTESGRYNVSFYIRPTFEGNPGNGNEYGMTGRCSYDNGTYSVDATLEESGYKFKDNQSDGNYEVFLSLYANKKEVKEEEKKEESTSGSSSGMSEEEKLREAARHFAPDESTMTAEQKAGWSAVSREAVVTTTGTGAGMTISNAYQGPMCRLAFQMSAPAGYSLGHTYNMGIRSDANGNAGFKIPTDLMKNGRTYMVIFVLPGGRTVTTPALIPDTNGNISFNTTLLGLPTGSNYAMGLMYIG